MLGRKKDKAPESTPDQQLERRVDAMMDPSLPDEPVPDKIATPPEKATGADLPPLDIFSDPKTAPEVPKKLLKELGADVPLPESTGKPAEEPAVQPPQTEVPLDDAKTDAAVDDIVAKEGDTVLKAEDEASKPAKPIVKKSNKLDSVKDLLHHWWFWPIVVLVVLAVLAGVPFSRYKLAGLVLKHDIALTVTDSTTGTAVSDVVVSIDGKTAKTDAAGKAMLHVPVGPATATISKQYYQTFVQKVTVPLLKNEADLALKLVASGRQVPLEVVDAVNGAALKGAEITVLGTTAKTDGSGKATIVLPAKGTTASASIELSGYNTAQTSVTITDTVVPANTLKLVPTGTVYFLSNASGKIDVVKANLDGSDRQTVLAGTGSEDQNNTVLLASSDWQYLALLTKRDGSTYPKLMLITASNGKVTTIDDGALNLTPVGWLGHTFIYRADNPNANNWQSGATAIKSFAAEAGKSTTLASTTASGTSNADAQYQNIWDTVIMGNYLVYDTTWYTYPGALSVNGQQNNLAWIKADGSGGKTLKTVDAGSLYFSNLKLVKPNQLDFGVYSSASSSATYYRLDNDGNSTQDNTITDSTINQSYPAYLISPAGSQTFWGEVQDGKHTLFVGDQNGQNAQTIASESDYTPYAWYSDTYLLVSQNDSELFIMAKDGKSPPLKISNYYKPAQNFSGYGGQ